MEPKKYSTVGITKTVYTVEHILLIEDNPADIEIITQYLREASFTYQLHSTCSLQEGLEIIRHHPISIVLLDLQLEDAHGIHTLRAYMEEAYATPVVVLTGTRKESAAIQVFNEGAQDFLIKGHFDEKQLVRTIRHTIERFKATVSFKQEYRQLLIRDKRQGLIHEMSKFGYWEMDILSQIMTWTPEMYRILDIMPTAETPEKLTDYLKQVHFEDKQKVEQFFEDVVKNGAPAELQHRIIIGNRTIKYLNLYAQVTIDELSEKILLIGGIKEISERQHAQRAPEISQSLNSITKFFMEASFAWTIPLITMAYLVRQMEETLTSAAQRELLQSFKVGMGGITGLMRRQMNAALVAHQEVKAKKEVWQLIDWKLIFEHLAQWRELNVVLKWNFGDDPPIKEKVLADGTLLVLLLFGTHDYLSECFGHKEQVALTFSGKKIIENGIYEVTILFEPKSTNIQPEKAMQWKQRLQDALQRELYYISDDYSLTTVFVITKIVKLLNATLEIKDTLSIEIKLPLEIHQHQPVPKKEYPDSPVHILIVDDNSITRLALRNALQAWSEQITITSAENGMEGLKSFSRNAFDLVLLDTQMPIMDGLETLRKMRIVKPTPIVMLLPQASIQDQKTYAEAGANAFLVKPINETEMFNTILQLVAT